MGANLGELSAGELSVGESSGHANSYVGRVYYLPMNMFCLERGWTFHSQTQEETFLNLKQLWKIQFISWRMCQKRKSQHQVWGAIRSFDDSNFYLNNTQRNVFEILLNQTEITLYLPCTDWFGTANVHCAFAVLNKSRKMVNTIWFWFDLIRFRKDFSVCAPCSVTFTRGALKVDRT